MELWHNARCSTSRAAKALLDERGVAYEVRDYLGRPPDAAELAAVLAALGMEPWDLARLGEPLARDLGVHDWPHERERWITLLVAHPVLIQRPILVAPGGRAAVGRPPAAVLDVVGTDPGRGASGPVSSPA